MPEDNRNPTIASDDRDRSSTAHSSIDLKQRGKGRKDELAAYVGPRSSSSGVHTAGIGIWRLMDVEMNMYVWIGI